ncbi:MAG TPA: pyruvate formate lyase-activating protein [Firmicutes bacterium]|nr:pyruvate formate lyase-activating protein [Bacillota bacterium]
MTGFIHSFESFGTVDGPGIRFVVFMQGCPMRCRYCHNPDTWNPKGGTQMTAEEVAREVLKYKNYFAERGGVTVSGGEPLFQLDFVLELFSLLKKKGISTCLDTSGICFREGDERFERLAQLTDLVLLDIKHIDEDAHRALTGHSNQNPLSFARFLDQKGVKMWVRHVLVPDITDNDEALMRLRAFLDTLSNVEKVEVLPYHTMGVQKYRKLGIPYSLEGVQPPAKERVENAKRILRGRA